MTKICNNWNLKLRLRSGMKMAALTALLLLCFSTAAFADTDSGEKGPGVAPTEAAAETELPTGESLGIFQTTGYCSCDKCSNGSGLTYSGTTPQANHTISADLTILPLGTEVRIGDVIYTVEDMGGGVDGHKIDIYYATHDEALAHGRGNAEVFLISRPEDKQAEAAAESTPAVKLNGPGEEYS